MGPKETKIPKSWALKPEKFPQTALICASSFKRRSLVLETPQPKRVAGMKWLLGNYTAHFNRRHKLFGHLFSRHYQALIVDGSVTGYLRTVCDYAHLKSGAV